MIVTQPKLVYKLAISISHVPVEDHSLVAEKLVKIKYFLVRERLHLLGLI